jgi:hypothetical protein
MGKNNTQSRVQSREFHNESQVQPSMRQSFLIVAHPQTNSHLPGNKQQLPTPVIRLSSPFCRDFEPSIPTSFQGIHGFIAVPPMICPRILAKPLLQRIVQHVSEKPAEFLAISDNPVVRFVLPYMPTAPSQSIDLVGRYAL